MAKEFLDLILIQRIGLVQNIAVNEDNMLLQYCNSFSKACWLSLQNFRIYEFLLVNIKSEIHMKLEEFKLLNFLI